MSLLFSMLSRFLIALSSKNQCLFFSQLQSLSTVILEPRKIKLVTVFIVSPCICHEVMEWDAITFDLMICTYHIKTIPKKKKCKRLSENALQITYRRTEAGWKGEKKDIPIWKQSAKEKQGEILKKNIPKLSVQRNRGKQQNGKGQISLQEN